MLTIHITIGPAAGDAWPVSVNEPSKTCGTLRLDLGTVWPAVAGGVTPGRRLGDALFRGAVKAAYEQALAESRAQGDILRVLLAVEAEELQLLPWEDLEAYRDGEWGRLYIERAAVTFRARR